MPDNFAFMSQKKFISKKGPKTGMGSSSWLQNMQNRTSHTIYFTRIFFQQKFQKVSKKARFGPFFTNKIFSTHKRKVVGHEKLVNIGPSDQVFIRGKVVLIPNNPAEESQLISFQGFSSGHVS